jgi:hypothetical protein
MSYRCEVCRAVQPPKMARRVHVFQRRVPNFPQGTRLEIEKEIAVCGVCALALGRGVPLASLQTLAAGPPPAAAPVAPALPPERVSFGD